MAKASGALTVSVSTNDISNDILSADWSTPRGVMDITGVDKSAVERLLLLADMSITLTGAFNSDVAKSHSMFSLNVSTDTARATVLTHETKTLTATLYYTDYSMTRSTNGELTWTSPGVLQNGTAPVWA